MAEVSRVASISQYGYKNLSCPFCGYFLKVKIVPGHTTKENYTCKRCKSKLTMELVEEDSFNNDGSIRINLSVSSAVKTDYKLKLKNN